MIHGDDTNLSFRQLLHIFPVTAEYILFPFQLVRIPFPLQQTLVMHPDAHRFCAETVNQIDCRHRVGTLVQGTFKLLAYPVKIRIGIASISETFFYLHIFSLNNCAVPLCTERRLVEIFCRIMLVLFYTYKVPTYPRPRR